MLRGLQRTHMQLPDRAQLTQMLVFPSSEAMLRDQARAGCVMRSALPVQSAQRRRRSPPPVAGADQGVELLSERMAAGCAWHVA